jgi:Zn-dependent M32 family carboxypeptidase
MLIFNMMCKRFNYMGQVLENITNFVLHYTNCMGDVCKRFEIMCQLFDKIYTVKNITVMFEKKLYTFLATLKTAYKIFAISCLQQKVFV